MVSARLVIGPSCHGVVLPAGGGGKGKGGKGGGKEGSSGF